MYRPLLVMAAGAVFAFATVLSTGAARAHERCVCSTTESIPPVPPVAPLPPLPPVPPVPPEEGRRHASIQKEIIIIGPGGHRHVRRIVVGDNLQHLRRVRRLVRVREIDEDHEGRMTRDEFVRRAQHAFDEHDQNHDGVLDEEERDEMTEMGEAPEAVDPPEAPEPPDADETPEPPRAPHAPHG